MCGIFGWSWKRNKKPTLEQRSILAATLGYLNDSRGGDSWGFYSPSSNQMFKNIGLAGEYTRALAVFDDIIGHTRKATKGAVSVENAHPFVIGQVVGAHNGMVYNSDDLDKKEKFEVDSQHIFRSLNEKENLKGLRGYGSIEWVDLRDGLKFINIARASDTAELSVCDTEHGFVWSSSKSTLQASIAMSGVGNHTLVRDLDAKSIHRVCAGVVSNTGEHIEFESFVDNRDDKYEHLGTYGSRYFQSRFSLHDDDERESAMGFRVTNKVRKTIGRNAGKSLLTGSATLCRECYREVDENKKCVKGHDKGVLVMKSAGTGP